MSMKVKLFYQMWLEDIKRPMLAYSSYCNYKNCVYRYIIPLYGEMKMEELTKFHIKRLYIKAFEKYPSVARILKTVLNTSLLYAQRNGYIKEDLVTGINWQKGISSKTRKSKRNALELNEILHLVEASQDSELYLPILFASLMGLRRSEIIGLKYSDIDYERKLIYIQRQLGVDPEIAKESLAAKTYTKQEIEVKTRNSKRKLEIPEIVFEAVLKERIRYEKRRSRRKRDFQDLDYIYCSSYGRPRTANYLGLQLKTFREVHGLSDITWHTLRFTYTTMLLSAGLDLKTVSRVLGHAKEIITADIYTDMCQVIRNHALDLNAWEEDIVYNPSVLEYRITSEMEKLLKFV